MKKLIVLLTMMMGTLAADAESYTYLTFETTDGAKVSVEASSLNITISGTTLTAGSQSFTLSNLSRMYFTSSNETTGIETLSITDWNEVSDIYDLKGRKVTKDQMRKGVYVIKTNSGTHKITVK